MAQEPDFEALFNASPYPYLLIAVDFTIIGANTAYLQSTGRDADDVVGKNLFEAYPVNPADPESTDLAEVRRSIELAISTRKPHSSALLRYAVPRKTVEGTVFDKRYWSAVHTPVLDEQGHVLFVSQNAIDVTELYTFDEKSRLYYLKQGLNAVPDVNDYSRFQMHEAMTRILDIERNQLRILFNQAPGFISVLAGPTHIFEMVNEA